MQVQGMDGFRSNLSGRWLCPVTGAAIVVFALIMCSAESEAGKADPDPLPPIEQVQDAIREHFSAIKDREENDILSQGNVAGIFATLEKVGWKFAAPARKSLLDRVLPDDDELVKELRTRPGTKFMRQCAKFPEAYDRLDRLRRMPYGMRRIRELIDTPGGYKLIEYLTVTQNGRNLGKQIAQGKNGKNFNEPTHRLYTPQDVLDYVVEAYRAELVRRKGGAQAKVAPASNP